MIYINLRIKIPGILFAFLIHVARYHSMLYRHSESLQSRISRQIIHVTSPNRKFSLTNQQRMCLAVCSSEDHALCNVYVRPRT